MPYQVRTETRATTSGLDGTVYILEDAGGANRAEIWPALGLNCYRWRSRNNDQPIELLYADPHLFENGKPTRSGIPILFPFPNRIREARFTWEGKEYVLPLNDSSGPNAIHGFACQRPWRVVNQAASQNHASLTAVFQGSIDARDARAYWPADYRLQITYLLANRRLRIEAQVDNPDKVPLPFGLGFHPYFHVPPETAGTCTVDVKARSFWELQKCLPTGRLLPVDAARDLNTPRRVRELNLDDVLTDLPDTAEPGAEKLCLRGIVNYGAGSKELHLLCSPSFRELVLFTPAHREAICIEPYTCTTDAIHLQAQGIDAGQLVLPPGARWSAVVEMVLN